MTNEVFLAQFHNWIGELRAVDPKNALKVGARAAEIEREARRRT